MIKKANEGFAEKTSAERPAYLSAQQFAVAMLQRQEADLLTVKQVVLQLAADAVSDCQLAVAECILQVLVPSTSGFISPSGSSSNLVWVVSSVFYMPACKSYFVDFFAASSGSSTPRACSANPACAYVYFTYLGPMLCLCVTCIMLQVCFVLDLCIHLLVNPCNHLFAQVFIHKFACLHCSSISGFDAFT